MRKEICPKGCKPHIDLFYIIASLLYSKHSAKQNSKAFWNEHSKSSNKIGNSYISPYDEYVNDLKLLKKIKKDTQFERDEVEKEYVLYDIIYIIN